MVLDTRTRRPRTPRPGSSASARAAQRPAPSPMRRSPRESGDVLRRHRRSPRATAPFTARHGRRPASLVVARRHRGVVRLRRRRAAAAHGVRRRQGGRVGAGLRLGARRLRAAAQRRAGRRPASSRRAGPTTTSASSTRPTTSPTSSPTATTRSAPRSATAGTRASVAMFGDRQYGSDTSADRAAAHRLHRRHRAGRRHRRHLARHRRAHDLPADLHRRRDVRRPPRSRRAGTARLRRRRLVAGRRASDAPTAKLVAADRPAGAGHPGARARRTLTEPGRRRATSTTSARTWSATPGCTLTGDGRPDRRDPRTPRCSTPTARSTPPTCAARRPPTTTPSRPTARRPTSRSSPSTASATSRSPASTRHRRPPTSPASSCGTDGTSPATLETSTALVNQLQSNIVWGQRGNFLSIPTDTPARDERLGWTGDINVFADTANYNMDSPAVPHQVAAGPARRADAERRLPGRRAGRPRPVRRRVRRAGWADAGITCRTRSGRPTATPRSSSRTTPR